MPRWLSGLDYVLGLLDRCTDSLYCSFFHIFATQLLMYYDIVTYSAYDSVEARALHRISPRSQSAMQLSTDLASYRLLVDFR